MPHLLTRSLEYSMRVRQFRAVVETKVDVAGIGGDVAESSSFKTGKLENDHFRVDRLEDFLGFWRLRQHQFTQRQRQVRHAWRTAHQKIQKLRGRLAHSFHLSSIIESPGKRMPASVTEA